MHPDVSIVRNADDECTRLRAVGSWDARLEVAAVEDIQSCLKLRADQKQLRGDSAATKLSDSGRFIATDL
jgi:hypothetical protein